MRNALSLARRILQQFSHDPHTVILFILAPLVILWLFSVILGSPAYHPRFAAVGLPDELIAALTDEDAHVTVCDEDASGSAQASTLLNAQEIDAVLTLDAQGTLSVEVEGTDSSKTQATMKAVQTALGQVAAQERNEISREMDTRFFEAQVTASAIKTFVDDMQSYAEKLVSAVVATAPAALASAGEPPSIPPALENGSNALDFERPDFSLTASEIEIVYLNGSDDWGLFDFIGPLFIGIFIFVFVFITSGMSLVTERTGGTMERLLVTPIKSWQLVCGYALGFGLVALIQSFVVLVCCILLIGFPNEGSLALVVLVTFSMALVSLTLGLLVSALARTAFQVIQFMIVLVVPQILFSGIFDLSQSPAWMQTLSQCFPITHGADALRGIMLRGAETAEILPSLAILWAFICAFFLLATLSFNRRRSQ
jgi:ABC-2 type transport system permease protein